MGIRYLNTRRLAEVPAAVSPSLDMRKGLLAPSAADARLLAWASRCPMPPWAGDESFKGEPMSSVDLNINPRTREESP